MKANTPANAEDDDLSVAFKECEVTILAIDDLKTSFGDKVIDTVSDGSNEFQIFLNATSQKKLIEAYGDDDKAWIGMTADLSLEKNEKFKNDMIVFNPQTA